jgi:hypothetical protein
MRRPGRRSYLSLCLVTGALLLSLCCGQPMTAQAQDSSTAPIQGQPLAPPPNTSESGVLGSGTPSEAPPALPGEIAPPANPPAPEAPPQATTATPAAPDWVAKSQANLVILDKIYGNAKTVSATVGTPFAVRFLTITVLACWARPPTLPPDDAVFLQVTDSHAPAGSPPKFRGWIFKAEPALSGMTDAATDVSVNGCR